MCLVWALNALAFWQRDKPNKWVWGPVLPAGGLPALWPEHACVARPPAKPSRLQGRARGRSDEHGSPCTDQRSRAYPRSRSCSSPGGWRPTWRKAWGWLSRAAASWVPRGSWAPSTARETGRLVCGRPGWRTTSISCPTAYLGEQRNGAHAFLRQHSSQRPDTTGRARKDSDTGRAAGSGPRPALTAVHIAKTWIRPAYQHS